MDAGSHGIGTVLPLVLLVLLLGLLVYDLVQKKHALLRNYPVIGHVRYILEPLGVYLRQYFYANDREEWPFDRATRSWIYETAHGKSGIIGFGSSNDMTVPGSILFVNAPFPVLEEDRLPTPPLLIGEGYCEKPFLARSVMNISGMSYGAISGPAIEALSRGAAVAGCWLNTGEGGLAPHHLAGDCDLVMQIGTAKYGIRNLDGSFSSEKAKELAKVVKAFEIKLSQGAKPGKGGLLLAEKVVPEIAEARGIPVYQDSISPNRHYDIANVNELLDRIAYIRDLTGRPVGFKTAIGGYHFINEVCDAVLRRGLQDAPDFITIDGGEGGSGAAPQALVDYMSLPIMEGLPRVADSLMAAGLKARIKLVAGGKLVTSAKAAWALCVGADFVNTARGFMFALGCIQALRCHTNKCPTGIATHNRQLQRGLVVEDKYMRVANYARAMNQEIDMIAHSCGCRHARELRREHVRIVQTANQSIALNMLYPYPVAGSRLGTKPIPGATG